jgi:hypothetical protein
MTKLDWTKAKTYRESEIKYDEGTERRNGQTVKHRIRDSLEARARATEKAWLKQLGKEKI